MNDANRGRPLAVFDLDGTLADTLGDLANAANHALAAMGFPLHEEADYRFFVGSGARRLIERALPEGERAEGTVARGLALFSAFYAEHFLDRSRPYAGVVEMLDALRAEGVALAVVSNKPHAFTRRMVEAFFGEERFAQALGHREGVPHKPDPSAVRGVISRLGAGRAVYIGDSDVDVLTGHNAGLPAVGCAWGFRGETELRAAGADVVARAPGDVPSIVRRLLEW